MERTCFSYEVLVDIKFTKKEIEAALMIASNHYDHTCRKALFLRCLSALFDVDDEMSETQVWTSVRFRDLDIVAKTLEMSPYHPDPMISGTGLALKEDIDGILRSMNEEYKRVSGTP